MTKARGPLPSSSGAPRSAWWSVAAFTLSGMVGSELVCLLIYLIVGVPVELDSTGGRLMVIAPLLAPALVAPVVAFPLARSRERALSLIDQLHRTTDLLSVEVAERRAAQQQLEFHARHDDLTGVLNRRGFFEAAGEVIGQRTLVLVDLDDFKLVNDVSGHFAGDRALVAVCAALTRAVGENALVARLGGDEFVALLRSDEFADIERIAEELREVAVRVDDTELTVSASTGGVVLTTETTIDAALAQADAQMYRAKRGPYRRRMGA